MGRVPVPNILPPLQMGDRLLIDGGVMNNMPADRMRATGRGPVIGLDVMSTEREMIEAVREKGQMPGILTTLLRATMMNAEAQSQRSRAACDMVFLPDVVDVAPNAWARFDELVERGYEHARAQLVETDLGPLLGR